MNNQYSIRPLYEKEWEDGMQLAWDTFLIYEAPEYSKEGIINFHDFVRDKTLKRMFLKGEYVTLGAFLNGTLVGILGVRNKTHISLLFVDTNYHHQKIATSLLEHMFEYVVKELGMFEMTVNSSPYAVEFYHKIGFTDLAKEQLTDGIRYTPMKIRLNQWCSETI